MAKYPLTELPEFAMMAVRVFYGKGSKAMKRKAGIILIAAAVLGLAAWLVVQNRTWLFFRPVDRGEVRSVQVTVDGGEQWEYTLTDPAGIAAAADFEAAVCRKTGTVRLIKSLPVEVTLAYTLNGGGVDVRRYQGNRFGDELHALERALTASDTAA